MLQMANRKLNRAVVSYHQWKEMRTYFLIILIFYEPMYCTSRLQSRGLQHADCSAIDITSVEAQDKFRSKSDSNENQAKNGNLFTLKSL